MFREWSEVEGVRLINGDCLDVMPTLEAGSVDAIVTDPPYGLGFMGRAWDHKVPGPEYWRAALRVVKPGALLFAFGGTRTYHRLASAIEDAGWTIRDSLCWLYGTGWPKNKHSLKPGWEPVVEARAPGGEPWLGVDEARIPHGGEVIDATAHGVSSRKDGWDRPWKADPEALAAQAERRAVAREKTQTLGRWPANVVLTHEAECGPECVEGCPVGILGEQSGVTSDRTRIIQRHESIGYGGSGSGPAYERTGDIGTAARFFYVTKPDQTERAEAGGHPTIKPVAFVEWLIRLACPPGGLVLDPFAGSGTTPVAARNMHRRCIAIERDTEHGYFEAQCRRLRGEREKTPLFD